MADNSAALRAKEPALLKDLITELEEDSIDLVEQSSLGPIVEFLIDICTPETWPTVRLATQLCLKKLGHSGANLDYDFPTVLGLVRLYMHEGKQGPNYKVFLQILQTSLGKRTPNLTYLPLIYAKAQKNSHIKGRFHFNADLEEVRTIVNDIPSIVLKCFELSSDSFISELTPDLFEMVPYVNEQQKEFYVNLMEELIATGLINDRFDSVSLRDIRTLFEKAFPAREIMGLNELINSRQDREQYWKSCSIQDDIHLDKPL
jgi:sulfur relay (sulfurtransferase) DsrC/TusE family protein